MKELFSAVSKYILSNDRNFTNEDTVVINNLVDNAEEEIAVFKKSKHYKKLVLTFNHQVFNEKETNKNDVFLNSYAIHHRDFDEMSYSIGGHPIATLYPIFKLLSSSEQDRSSLLQGLKVEIALGKVFNPELYDSQYHPTSIIGALGSTALSAKLLKLTEAQTINALGVATSFLGGIKGNFGSNAKALQVANATQNGLFSALCSKNGFTSNINLLQQNDTLKIFINKTIGKKEARSLSLLLKKSLTLSDEFLFKKYNVCGSFHGVIDLALKDRKQFMIRMSNIKEVQVQIHSQRLRNKFIELPQDALQKKFSPGYLYSYVFLGKNIEDITKSDTIPMDILNFMKKVRIINSNTIKQWDYKSVFKFF